MDCLSPEQMAAYVRGGGTEPHAVEAHVRDCPGCAMELLLVRETLGELRSRGLRPGTDRLRLAAKKRPVAWIPWAVAAALLVAALVFAVLSSTPTPPAIVKAADPAPPVVLPAASPEVPKAPAPLPRPVTPAPEPELPRTPPDVRPEPRPERTPEPPKSAVPPSAPPAPEPATEPKKPASTMVEKAIVAHVVHSIGSTTAPVGRAFRVGETVATSRQEFLEIALEGVGRLFFRENSQADLGAGGEITLHEGEMLAKLEPGRKFGTLKLPVVQVEPLAPVFNVLATRTSAEISILDGRIAAGSATARGPATLIVKNGKAPEIRPLDPGFASWIPDKLAAKKYTGWFEAEEFSSLQGFRVSAYEGSSGGKAAVQIADQGGLAAKLALPFKGRHVVWVKARQYEPKAVMIGIHLNGQSAAEVKLDATDGKPWRWIGPLMVTSDHLDLGITALSRWPLKEGDERRSFPVVIDAVAVSSDPKFVPPEKRTEDARPQELAFEEPVVK
jgi:hypothetical protein